MPSDDLNNSKNKIFAWGKATHKDVRKWQRVLIIVILFSLFTSFVMIGFTSSKFETSTKSNSNHPVVKYPEMNVTYPRVKLTCDKWSELFMKSKSNAVPMKDLRLAIIEIDNVAQSSKYSLLKTTTRDLREAIVQENIVEFKKLIGTLAQICNNYYSSS